MFHVYRSNDLEALADWLSVVTRRPLAPGEPLDPLAPETVVVQSRVLERWLSQQLAQRQGIWANPRFPFPRASVEELLAAVLGDQAERDAGVFVGDRLRFAVARHLPEAVASDPAAFAAVARYLGSEDEGEDRGRGDAAAAPRIGADATGGPGEDAAGARDGAVASPRLLQLSAQVAELFDRYALYRPERVCGWDRTPEPEWQSLLWHRLIQAHGATHIAARALRFGQALPRGGAAVAALPPRIHLFAVRTLPPLFLQIFAAVSRFREVYLYQLSPCREYWADLRREDLGDGLGEDRRASAFTRAARSPGGGDDAAPGAGDAAPPEGNPLLVSLGRLGADFQTLLEEWVPETVEEGERWVDPLERQGGVDGVGAGATRATALRILQSDVLALRHRRPGGAVPPVVVERADRSISVHACSGPMREAEVLRDQLLDAFDSLEDLQPHEVAVLCPDMATYAPFLQAVLDVAPGEPGYLPFTLSDRAPRQALRGLEAFGALLELLESRLPLSAVEALLAREPVRARFSLSAEEADTTGAWLRKAGARWGEDAAHREAVGRPASRAFSLRLALDRLVLGYAVESDGWSRFGGVLPMTPPGRERGLLGRVTDFCEALFEARRIVAAPATIRAWQERVGLLLGGLLSGAPPWDWQAQLVRDAAADLAAAAGDAGFEAMVGFEVYRGLLLDRLDVSPAPRGFLSGGVTVAELRPLRSVPFRVVALIGMNDGAFPRTDRRPAFDQVASAPRRGDRSARDDDRYQLLETLLATRDRVIVTYAGIDPGQGSSRPPSVLVADLLDVLGESVIPEADAPQDASPGGPSAGVAVGDRARGRAVTRHPLHPFDPRYFTAGATGVAAPGVSAPGDALFSYEVRHLAGARALLGPRQDLPLFFPREALLPPEPRGRVAAGGDDPDAREVDLAELARSLLDPTAELLGRRLGVALVGQEGAPDDVEPVSLDGLSAYQVREILMERLGRGEDVSEGAEVLLARGLLPLGSVGRAAFAAEAPVARAMVRERQRAQGGTRREPLPVRIPLPGGVVVGWLREVYPAGQVIASPGKLTAKRLMRAWVRHLALCGLGELEVPGETVLLGLGDKANVVTRTFLPVAVDAARDRLADLLALHWLARQAALPLFPDTSRAYAEALAKKPDDPARALGRARARWRGSRWSPGESGGAAYALVYGGTDPISAPAGVGADGRPDERLSFAALARRVWSPLLAGSQGETR